MFNDDDIRSALTKMYEYSPVDGFVDISEGLGSMIKSLANEPSVGLFYVQQHAHNAVPNLVNHRNNIVTKSREISLHTEDTGDSIAMVRSMADCGFPIVDDMIKDITKSLAIMSSKQPRKGLISKGSVSRFGSGRTGSWGRTAWRGEVNDVEKSTSYLSTVFGSVKQKATDLNWAQQDTSESTEETTNGSANVVLNLGEELPVSSRVSIGYEEEDDTLVDDLISDFRNSLKDDGKEARFEEWLEGNDTQHKGTNE